MFIGNDSLQFDRFQFPKIHFSIAETTKKQFFNTTFL